MASTPGYRRKSPSAWRRTPLPTGWEDLRAVVLDRDRACMWPDDGTSHDGPLEVDHINGADDHNLDNLQALCRKHHRTKTGRENAARQPKRRREPEKHPGIV